MKSELGNHAAGSSLAEVTPEEYLEQHPLTRLLISRGLTKIQLDSVHFRADEALEFSLWPVVSLDWPIKLLNERLVYCALRWLVLINPPSSRDTRDAWGLLERYGAQFWHDAGLKQSVHGKSAGEDSHKKMLVKAQEFSEKVNRRLLGNPKMSLTGAVTAEAAAQHIGRSTAWNYMKKAGNTESTPDRLDME